MAMTLIEASKLVSGEVKRSAVIEMFAAASDLMRILPFENVVGGSLAYNVEGALPGVAFRGFNEAYAESVGVLNPQVEVLKIAGGDLDVDKAIIKTRGADVRASHEAMKAKAMALYITKKVIKGDSETNPREFDGLQKRVTGSQLFWGDGSSTKGPLSLAVLDEAIDSVDDPSHLIMSKAMRRRLSAAARDTTVSGDLNWVRDEFGQQVAMYNDLPIATVDYDDEGKRILDFNEGAGNDETSIYVASFGENKLLGLQNDVMEVTDLGELDSKPVLRTRVEWLTGLAVMHGRAIARLKGITDAAVTA